MKNIFKCFATIFLNLVSSYIWAILISAFGVIAIQITNKFNFIPSYVSIIIILFLTLCYIILLTKEDFYRLKWGYIVKNNKYTLTLHDNEKARFQQEYLTKLNRKFKNGIYGTYDWNEVECIASATTRSNYSKCKVYYQDENKKKIYVDDNVINKKFPKSKFLSYAFEYPDINPTERNNVENIVSIDMTYNKQNLKNELFAIIKSPVKKLELIIVAPDNLIKNVNFTCTTCLGDEYTYMEKTVKAKRDVNNLNKYCVSIKPKLFCCYKLTWQWVNNT